MEARKLEGLAVAIGDHHLFGLIPNYVSGNKYKLNIVTYANCGDIQGQR